MNIVILAIATIGATFVLSLSQSLLRIEITGRQINILVFKTVVMVTGIMLGELIVAVLK